MLAWDKLEPSNPLSCIGTDLQPNTLRMQALSTLAQFIPNYFECLRPSMPLLIRTIRLCLKVIGICLNYKRPTTYNFLVIVIGIIYVLARGGRESCIAHQPFASLQRFAESSN